MFRPLVGTPAARKKPKTKSKWCEGFLINDPDLKNDELAKSQRAASMARKDFYAKFGRYVRRNCAENAT